MVFMALAGERENAPYLGLPACLSKDLGFFTRNLRSCFVHLLLVIHDAVGAVLRKHDEIHSRQAGFHANDHVGNFPSVLEHFRSRMQAWHLVVDDGDADGVEAAANISVNHCGLHG